MTTYIPSLTLPAFLLEKPAFAVLFPIMAGSAVGVFTSPNQTKKVYSDLKQPPMHPPSWVFGPVWTILYGMMGYSAYRAWTTGVTSLDMDKFNLARHGATVYTVQLGLNLLWMPLFFGMGKPIAATVDILALGGSIAYLMSIWGKVDPMCGWLLAPYLAWVSFATYLCAGCGYLNNWDFSKAKKSD